jgi:hypothetical protein
VLFTGLQKKLPGSLFALPSLVARLGQKFSVFMLSHFLSSLFYDTAQWLTPFYSNLRL